MNLGFNYNDGGRSNYFKGENVGDCVCRAISIATGKDYKEVYDLLNETAKKERIGKRKNKISNARNGVFKVTYQKVLKSLGWEWHPTMTIGSGCTTHMRKEELPSGTIIVSLSRHLSCVIDGVVNDTYDCTRDGNRCVYGYFKKEEDNSVKRDFIAELNCILHTDKGKKTINSYEEGEIDAPKLFSGLAKIWKERGWE